MVIEYDVWDIILVMVIKINNDGVLWAEGFNLRFFKYDIIKVSKLLFIVSLS